MRQPTELVAAALVTAALVTAALVTAAAPLFTAAAPEGKDAGHASSR
jgi:hypothetical protein